MDAPVKQQPLVKAAQAAQLARRRTLVDAVAAQMLQKGRHILLSRRQQHAVAALDELGKGLQVAVIGLAGERAQPLFHAQIGLVVLQQR
jgi:chorismate mutase